MINYLKRITGSNLRRNILGTFLIKGVSIVVQLLLVPLTLGYLSEQLYGIWLTISSLVLSLSFFDIGFSLGLKNRLTEAIAHKDYEKGKRLVSTTYGVLILIFVPIGLLLEALLPLVNWSSLLNVDGSLNTVLSRIIRVLLISFVLQMIFNTIATILSAFQKVAFANSLTVIGNIISLGVIWLLTQFTEPSLMNMALTVAFIPVIVYGVSSLFLFRGKLKSISPSIKYFSSNLIKDLFSLGIKFFIIQLQIVIMQQATNLLISHVSNPDYVTFFNIAYRYIGISTMIMGLIVGPIWPAFTEAYTKGNLKWMRQVYWKLYKVYFIFLGLTWIMCLIAPFVYRIWLGKDVQIPATMTILISCYVSQTLWNCIHANLINGVGAIKLQSNLVLLGIFLQIPLSLLLGHFIGAYGVIVSMISITLVYCIVFTIQIRKIINNQASGIWIA